MNIIITAGGTEEPIDAVRKITNMSTGRLGAMICDNLTDKWFMQGTQNDNHIYYICNKNSIKPETSTSVTIINTTDTASVEWSMGAVLGMNNIDFFIHSMAVSDYTVQGAYDLDLNEIDTSSKMKSTEDEMYLKLVKTPKLIDSIKRESPNIKLISFKLLNDVSHQHLLHVGRAQLERTQSTLVVANDLKDIKEGNHTALIIRGDDYDIISSKEEIAKYIAGYVDFLS